MVRFGRSWAFVFLSEFSFLVTGHSYLGEIQMAGRWARKSRRNGGELLRRNHRLNSVLRVTLAEKMAFLAVAEIPIVTHRQRRCYAPPDFTGLESYFLFSAIRLL